MKSAMLMMLLLIVVNKRANLALEYEIDACLQSFFFFYFCQQKY